MKISPILFLGNQKISFNSKTKENQISTVNSNSAQININTLKAYKMSSIKNLSFGNIKAEEIKYNEDDISYSIPIRPNKANTKTISVTYQTSLDGKYSQPTTVMAEKTEKGFILNIPAIERKTNKFYDIHIIDLLFNDEQGKLIDKKSYDKGKMSVLAKRAIPTVEKVVNFDGEKANLDFYVGTGAKNEGYIKKYTKWEELKRNTEKRPIIAYLEDMDNFIMDVRLNDAPIPKNVKGIFGANKVGKIEGFVKDALGHIASRMRDNKQAFVLFSPEADKMFRDKYVDKGDKILSINVEEGIKQDNVEIKEIDKLTPKIEKEVIIPRYKLVNRVMTPEDSDFSVETVGLKAFNLGKLKNMKNRKFQVPKFVVIPAGMIDKIKHDKINNDVYGLDVANPDERGTYHGFVKEAAKQNNPEASLAALRNLVENNITIPEDIRKAIVSGVETELGKLDFGMSDMKALLDPNKKESAKKQLSRCLIARSSFNGEDSATFATQGIYSSIPGIRDKEQLYKGIKHVWASKWSDIAYQTRKENGIDHRQIQPNVIVQNVVPVDYTYTIYTANPKTKDTNKILIQLSQGVDCNMGGCPYFFEYDKATKEVKRLMISDKGRKKTIDEVVMNDPLKAKYSDTDYSNDVFNKSKAEYTPVIRKIADVALSIEKEFGGIPQDIEGGIKFNHSKKGATESKLYIWQTRDAHLF